jgi:hypothetical protein
MRARSTCFCRRLRSAKIACNRSRSAAGIAGDDLDRNARQEIPSPAPHDAEGAAPPHDPPAQQTDARGRSTATRNNRRDRRAAAQFRKLPVYVRTGDARPDAPGPTVPLRQHRPSAGFRLSDAAHYRDCLRAVRRDRRRCADARASRAELEPLDGTITIALQSASPTVQKGLTRSTLWGMVKVTPCTTFDGVTHAPAARAIIRATGRRQRARC